MFVSPSNPTGAVYSPDEVEAIGRWAASHGIWVRHRRDLRAPHLRRARVLLDASLVPELGDRCVIVNGVAKTYAMTGWRVGWMIGPADVIKAATNLQSHPTSNVANVSQRAALAAVSGPLDAVAEMRAAFDRRGTHDGQPAARHPGRRRARTRRARSTPSPRSKACSVAPSRAAGADTTIDLAEVILDEAKVAIVPGEAFARTRLRPAVVRARRRRPRSKGITRIADLLAEG